MTVTRYSNAVVLDGRNCAVLWQAADLNALRIRARGQDDDLYQMLVKIYETALEYRDSVSGKGQQRAAESEGDWLWWSTAELAARAGCTPRTIRNHIRSGYIQATLRGREWIIRVEEGQKYLQSHRLR